MSVTRAVIHPSAAFQTQKILITPLAHQTQERASHNKEAPAANNQLLGHPNKKRTVSQSIMTARQSLVKSILQTQPKNLWHLPAFDEAQFVEYHHCDSNQYQPYCRGVL